MPTSLPRITTRVDEATQSLLSRAAALAGLPSINAFVVNAAKASLVAGITPEGDEWAKTLEEAEKSKDPFVQISVTLYKLCNFQDRENNSRLLHRQLDEFKRKHPDYYKLIGFTD